MNTTLPTNYERVKRSKAKKIAAGGKHINDVLTPESTEALEALLLDGYETTSIGAIRKALLEAKKRLKKE
jgi:hypothetical protein